jgi:alpha-beta hydrolase superfamily lysophospholipase
VVAAERDSDGTPAMSMTEDEDDLAERAFIYAGKDGVSVAAYRWSGAEPARFVVQIAHGMAEHARRYIPVVLDLIAAGAMVYANDHRGHGRTAGSIDALGDFGAGGYDAMPEDMAILTRQIRQEQPGLPIILLGHSMGSFAAQVYALDHSDLIDGLVLSGSTAIDEFAKARAEAGGALNTAFEPSRTPYDWLSRDEAVVDAYIADPYCGFQGRNRSASQLGGQRAADPEQLKRIRPDLPIYLFAGDKDPLNGDLAFLRVLIERYRAAGVKDVTYDFYPGGRHEMLNETNRGEVIANLVRWMHRVVG